MPGTIRISVLDIIDLPSPPPTSSMSIKVSVGKREYQRAEPGDLSIPLTTLRENLIVKLLDNAGNEISRAGVETRSIIEKGIWDEVFPLEGGGKMHLKMQFILSEEEQSRIRMMRLSALKKKHGELVTNSSPRGPEKNFERSVTASLSLQTISRSSSLEGGHSILASRPANLHGDGSGNTNKAITERKAPEASSTEEHSSKVLDKIETQSGQFNDFNRGGSNGEKAASSLPPNQPKTASKTSDPNMEMRIERTPSNVRKMISVFETSLAPQDTTRPSIKPPPIKLKSSTSGIMAPDQAEESKKKGIISITPLLNSERIISERVRENGEESVNGCFSGRSPDESSCRDLSMKQAPESERIISERPVRDIVVAVSGRCLDDESCRDSLFTRNCVEKEEVFTKVVEVQSDEERKLWSYRENEEERAEGWIFLEEARDYYCATAIGKQAMHTVERHISEAASASRGSNQENRGKNTVGLRKSDPEANRGEKQRKSKMDGSVDSSGGGPLALGQVVKIAIMVGFGALVLFTRQRKDR